MSNGIQTKEEELLNKEEVSNKNSVIQNEEEVSNKNSATQTVSNNQLSSEEEDYQFPGEDQDSKDELFTFGDKSGIELFNSEEEQVVKEMKRRFGHLKDANGRGFQFEESGILDNMVVTAPNGEQIKFALDTEFFFGDDPTKVRDFNEFMLSHSKGMDKEQFAKTYDEDVKIEDVRAIQNGETLSNTDKEEARLEAEEIHAGSGTLAKIGEFLREKGESLRADTPEEMIELMTNPNKVSWSKIKELTGAGMEFLGETAWLDPARTGIESAEDFYNKRGNKIQVIDENTGEPKYDEDGNPIMRDVTAGDISSKALDFTTQEQEDRQKQTKINEMLATKGWSITGGGMFDGSLDYNRYLAARAEGQVSEIDKAFDSEAYKNVKLLSDTLLDYSTNYTQTRDKLLEKIKNKEPITAEEAKNFQNLQDNFQRKYDLYNKVKGPWEQALIDQQEYTDAADQLDNINHWGRNLGATLAYATEDLGGSIAWLGGNVLEFPIEMMTENGYIDPDDPESSAALSAWQSAADGLKGLGKALNDNAEENKTFLKEQPKGYNGILNFAEKALGGVAENLPQLALASMTGGGSIGANMAVFGLSGTSTKHFEMTEEMELFKRTNGKQGAMYNTQQLLLAPSLYGIAESITMVPEVMMMRGTFSGAVKKGVFGKGFFGKVGNNVLDFGAAAGTELAQEIPTQIGQNAVDIWLGKDVELSDGIDTDFIIKVVGSAGVFNSVPKVGKAGQAAWDLAFTRNMKSMDGMNNIAAGAKAILDTNIEIGKLKNEQKLPNADVDAIQAKIEGLELKRKKQEKQQANNIKDQLDFSKIGTKGVNKLRGFAREQSQLQRKARKIKEALNLTPKEKENLLEQLKEEFNALESKKSQILNNENKYQLENENQVHELESQARDNLMEKNNGKVPSKQDIAKEAERIYDEQNYITEKNANEAKVIMENQVAKLESKALTDKINQIDPTKPINTLEATSLPEIKQKIIADMESKGYPKDSEQTQQALQEVQENWDNSAATILQPEVLQDGQKVLNTESHLFDKHQTVIVNKKKADTDANFAARGHELFHGMLWKAFKSSGKGFQNISEGLVTHINNKDKAGAEWLNDELTQLSPDDINYHEEVIAKIADGMRGGNIKVTPDISKRIGGLLRKTGQELGIDTKLMIKDPADMFELINSYNKNLKSDGRLSGALKSALEQGVVVDPKLQPKRQLQPDQRITKQYKDEKAFENKIQKLYDTYSKGIGKLVIPSPLTQQDLKQGETIVETEKDSKGRTITKISSTQEKNGIRTTKFSFNRNDKPTTQRNKTGVDPQTAFGNDLEVDRENSGVGQDIEITKVKEIREDIKTGKKSATVEIKGKGDTTMETEVILKPKAKPTTVAAQKLEGERALKEILESYKPRIKRILESEWKNYLEANGITPGTQRYNEVVDTVLNEKRGVLDMIMEYDIKTGVPLSGYIGSIMSKRGISEQVFFAVPDTQGMYKQEIDAQTRKIADEVVQEIVEAKKDLLKETINLDPSILNEVVNAVTKTFGLDLGDIKSPQFKKKLADNFKLQLGKKIKDMLGTRAGYQNYLENNWENIWKAIPQDIVNKSFPELKEAVLDSKGKPVREKTKAGNPLFKKKKLTQKEFMDYFMPPAEIISKKTGKKVRSGLPGTRKQGLANAIAQTLARDEVMDVLSNPEVASKFEQINELFGRKLDKGWKAQVQKVIDGIDNIQNRINEETKDAIFSGPITPKVINQFLNVLKKGIKSGLRVVEALERAIEVLRNAWKKDKRYGKEIKKEWVKDHFDALIEEYGGLEEMTLEDTKAIIEEASKDPNFFEYDFSDKIAGEQFIQNLKKYVKNNPNDIKMKEALESVEESTGLKSYQFRGKRDGQKVINTEANNKKAKQANKMLSMWPKPFHDILQKLGGKSMMYEGVAMQQDRGLTSNEYTKDGKTRMAGKENNYFDDIHMDGKNSPYNMAPKDIDAAVKDGKISKELGDILKKIDPDKVQGMNLSKPAPKKGSMMYDIKNIVENKDGKYKSVKEKQEAIDAAYEKHDGDAIAYNNKLLYKAQMLAVKEAYQNNIIDDTYLVSMFAMGSNSTAGPRSLTGFAGIELKPGKQDLSKFKGEHVNPLSNQNDSLIEWIRDENADIDQVNDVFDNNDQVFATETTLDIIDAKLGRTSKLGWKRFSKLSGNSTVSKMNDSVYMPGKLRKGDVKGPKGLSLTEKLLEDSVKEKLRADGKKSAEKSNKAYLPKNMSVETARLWDKAVSLFKKGNQPQKGITIVDFDQTLANTKEKVIVNMPDGTSKEIGAQEFAKEAGNLVDAGATFDFSQFEKVKGAKPGPILPKVKDLAGKYGTDQIHILTARPQSAAAAIQAFMKANGLDIKTENITGLEDGTPQAKRDFIIKKLAEGYNDFFFSDDSIQNVKEVKNILDQVDVKSKVYQAEQNFKKDLESEFGKILEENTGLSKDAQINKAKAKTAGAKKGSWFKNFWIPYSAEDFSGLLYALIGKGKKGESQWKFLKKALIDPFAKGIRDLNAFKQILANELGKLKKQYPDVTKALRKDSGISAYNNAHAIRVYNWSKAGYTAADLDISQTDFNNLIKHVEGNPDMKAFSDKLRQITKIPEGYPKPKENGDWVSGNIDTDIMDVGFIKRAEYLQEWKDNKDKIFSPEMMRKLEYQYGSKYVEAMNDMLNRMENGINRPQGSNRIVNAWQNWVNNSVGAIMFFNIRSAVLQTLSATNFINWSDNNPLMAAKAFANQAQFWKDFSFIFNHPTLKQRRAGMDIDVNAQEIAARVANSKNPISAALNWLLQKGFIPTRMADSFAIAIGGASMYRNRVNTYLKKGFTQKEAENKAFLDFQEISEATQQSARPDMISEQQASPLGRLVLAFQVTPMQYARLMKKAMQDLVAGRGDAKTHISKIIYYGAVQNFIFNAMQKALFAMLYAQDEEDEEEKMTDAEKKKITNLVNGMADSILRGLGVGGAVVSTVKNMLIKFLQQEKKGYRADHAYTLIESLNISPPIGSKARKIYNATQTYKFNRDAVKEMGLDINNPALEAIANVVSGTTNVPLDRALQNVNNVIDALDKRNAAWQRIATLMGWPSWQVDVPNREVEKAKRDIKQRKAEEKKRKKEEQKRNNQKK